MLSFLLDHGASFTACGKRTELMTLSYVAFTSDILTTCLLVEKDINLIGSNNNGSKLENPLSPAMLQRHKDGVKLLQELGAGDLS